MKKIALYSLLAAGMTLAACSDDYKDWAEPQGYGPTDAAQIAFSAQSVEAIDLRTVTDDVVRIFNPTMECNKDYQVYYTAALYNQAKTDSVVVTVDSEGNAARAQVQGAVVALYGTDPVVRVTPMNITAFVAIDGTTVRKMATDVNLSSTPKYQELPPQWYIIGADLGRGTWVNHKTMGLYTSLVAMYVNPYNYEELVYATYFPAGSEFRIVPEAGNKEKYIGGGNEEGGQSFQAAAPAEGSNLGNITVSDKGAGYYKVVVNVADPENPFMYMEKITAPVKVYSAMKLYVEGVTETDMSIITNAAKGENHDWLADVTVTADGQVLGLVGTSEAGATHWGGNAFPAGKAVKDGANIPLQPGDYKLVFNDLIGVYRFIAK